MLPTKKTLRFPFIRGILTNQLRLPTLVATGICLFLLLKQSPQENSAIKILSFFLLAAATTLCLLPKHTRLWVRFSQVGNLLGKPKVTITLTLLLQIYFFLQVFAFKDITKIPFLDDHPGVYSQFVRSLLILKQGALFGWEPNLLGGYPTAFVLNGTKPFFFIPFIFLGTKIGYHLMLLTFFLLLPILIVTCLKHVREQPFNQSLSLYIAAFINIFFLRNILLSGMVDVYLGLVLFVFALWQLYRMKDSKPYSFTLLSLALCSLAYTHIAFCIFACVIIAMEAFAPFTKKIAAKIPLGIAVLAATTFNYSYYLLRYHAFLKTNIYHSQTTEVTLTPLFFIGKIFAPIRFLAHNMHLAPSYTYIGIATIFIPFALTLLVNARLPLRRLLFYFLGAYILLSFSSASGIGLILNRIDYLLPFFLIVTISAALTAAAQKQTVTPFLLFTVIALNALPLGIKPIPHAKGFTEYNAPLYNHLKRMDGNMILFENRWSLVNSPAQPPLFHTHFTVTLAMDLQKPLFASMGDGHTFSTFGKNCVYNGMFRGKPLSEINPNQFNAVLNKWGIHTLAVWSNIAKDYLQAHPQFYRQTWHDVEWSIFTYNQATPESVTIPTNPQATGTISKQDYFTTVIELRNVTKGDNVIVKMNYFPEWQASWNNTPLSLYDDAGQMGFRAPFSGNGSVQLTYPKHRRHLLLMLLAFLLAGAIEISTRRKAASSHR